MSERTGLPMPDGRPQQDAKAEKVGFAGLFSRAFWFANVVTGLMNALAQGLNYFVNTWLPVQHQPWEISFATAPKRWSARSTSGPDTPV